MNPKVLIELGPAINDFSFDESLVRTLPIHVRPKGSPKEPRLPHHWMNMWLRPERRDLGSLGFMRTASMVYPHLFVSLCQEILRHFDLDVNEFRPQRMSLIRTTGSITPHTDEERGSCVTVGLLNSQVAKTVISADIEPENFEKTHEVYQAKDRVVYAMNTQALQGTDSVDLTTFRYLLTYSFVRSFDELMAARRINLDSRR